MNRLDDLAWLAFMILLVGGTLVLFLTADLL